jgi:hypothetical protein
VVAMLSPSSKRYSEAAAGDTENISLANESVSQAQAGFLARRSTLQEKNHTTFSNHVNKVDVSSDEMDGRFSRAVAE